MERKRIYLVGLGPGGREQMTQQAYAALADADVLCGYTGYVDLVRGWFPEKETYTTPMTQELARCRWALETAREGKSVAMLCSGDAGVYGMAGPLLQLTEGGEEVEITVVPGVTAALSGAAMLGAPLMHDFCVISLSDLLHLGTRLPSGWCARQRGTALSFCTTPAPRGGEGICGGPVKSCWSGSTQRRCADGSAMWEERGVKSEFSPCRR